MPDAKSHLEHALHNLRFLESFYGSHLFNDWSITVAFYSSVHLIEHVVAKLKRLNWQGKTIEGIEHSDQLPAFAEKNGLRRPNGLKIDTKSQHVLRNLIVEASDEFKEKSDYYISLYKKSRQSRYYQHSWTNQEAEMIMKLLFIPFLKWLNTTHDTRIPIPFRSGENKTN